MILAAQYYRPPFPERRFWQADLDGMKAAGLNALQLWVLWSWVEPEPERFIFDDYDELMEESRKAGLGVVLSSIAELHPSWIHRVIPDAAMIDHMGRAVVSTNRVEAHQGLTPGGCTDHPEVLRRMGTFLQTLAARYRNADNLLGWDIWNELRWNVQADGLVCFCPHTLAAFRGWLKAKYGDLAGLNAAWKRRYCDWADVMPGKLPGRPYTEMMEFEAFLQWRAGQHMRFRAAAIRETDPRHIVTAHGAQPSVHSAGNMENHAINRGNDWDLAEPLDGLGCSHFPFWFGMSDDDFGVRVECTRSAAGGKVVWVSELQGGSARQGFDVRPSVQARPQQRWVWNGYGRGAKAVIFWCWRDEVFGRESSGYGLAGLDGLAGERIAAMQETGKILREHADLLQGYRPDPAKVGVLFDPNTYNLEWAQDGTAARAMSSVVGYLTALERIQVPYEVVESSHLEALQGLKVLILPMPLVIPPATGQVIADFVRRGGTLLIEAEAGAFTELGFYRPPTGIFDYPGAERELAAALGVKDLGRRMLEGKDFTLAYGGDRFGLTASVFVTPLWANEAGRRSPSEGGATVEDSPQGEVLAKDACRRSPSGEGNVLAIENRVGEGTVLALGTFIGKPYNESRYADFERFLDRVIAQAGGLPDLQVTGTGPLQWRTGLSGGCRLLFITNPGLSQRVKIRGPREMFGDSTTATELHRGTHIPILTDAALKIPVRGWSRLDVEVGGGDFAILCWDK